MEIVNCSKCGDVYIQHPVREVCDACYKEEEALFESVYKFLRKRENRAATMPCVAEATGVDEALLQKWVRKGRLQTARFPNFGYPCDKCGTIIRTGKLCEKCAGNIMKDLEAFEEERERKEKQRVSVYHAMDDKIRRS